MLMQALADFDIPAEHEGCVQGVDNYLNEIVV